MRKFITEGYMPKRATKHSAGYDFIANQDILILSGQTIKFDTGVKVKMEEDDVLILAPRSSLGFKYNLTMDNTIGVIDADFNDTIKCKMTNNSKEDIFIKKGQAYMQGIFIKYLKTDNDEVDTIRTGGIGSTDEKVSK